jgi:hypothetical protein
MKTIINNEGKQNRDLYGTHSSNQTSSGSVKNEKDP